MKHATRFFLVGAWCWIVTGAGHIAFLAAKLAMGSPSRESALFDAMRAHEVNVLGITRSIWALYLGFSFAMGLFIFACGLLNLAVARAAPDLARVRSIVWVDLGASVIALGISALAFPPPPIILMSVAVVAFGLVLRAEPRGARAARIS